MAWPAMAAVQRVQAPRRRQSDGVRERPGGGQGGAEEVRLGGDDGSTPVMSLRAEGHGCPRTSGVRDAEAVEGDVEIDRRKAGDSQADGDDQSGESDGRRARALS